MKIVSYNINGIRAAVKKGFIDWLKASDADVVCLQEVKASTAQIPGELSLIEALGYHVYWNDAEKKGYSGVAILTKTKPDNVHYGMGIPKYDIEGRYLRADFGDLSVISVYMPSGSSGDERQSFKMEWLDDFYEFTKKLKSEREKLVIAGDYNICHKEIDIHNPKSNAKSSGFLPEERAWVSKFLELGFIDTFRHFNKEPHNYSWWSYRANAREKNLGWRIDYHMASEKVEGQLSGAKILPAAKHSDHCPIVVELK